MTKTNFHPPPWFAQKTSSSRNFPPTLIVHQNTIDMTKKHRGRIQAQGNGVEKSVTWSQDEPLSREQGKTLLQQLKGQLSAKEHAERAEQAERYIAGPMASPPRSGAPFRTAKPEMYGSILRCWRVGPSWR